MSDSLQPSRTTAILEGFVNGGSENVMGLLGEYCQKTEWNDYYLILLKDLRDSNEECAVTLFNISHRHGWCKQGL